MRKQVFSVLLLSLFMVTNTMAAGVSLPEKSGSFESPLLQDNTGKVIFFEAVNHSGSENIQKTNDNNHFLTLNDPVPLLLNYKLHKLYGTREFNHSQSFLFLILFPFHSFI